MSISFPGESAEYRAARNRVLKQEAHLRQATEAVAAARRALPPGGTVPEDYVFQQAGTGGTPTKVRLSELFAPGNDTLAMYSFMFPRALDDEEPCPSCTSFLDSFDGAAEHIAQRVNVAVVAKAPLPRILAHADKRGWRRLQLLSSAGNTYNRDYLGETSEGAQMPTPNVFRRDGGAVRHFWGSELLYAPTEPGQDPRHTDSIDPQWNLFDFTPEGRGTDWYPQLSYSPRVPPQADAAEGCADGPFLMNGCCEECDAHCRQRWLAQVNHEVSRLLPLSGHLDKHAGKSSPTCASYTGCLATALLRAQVP